MRRLLVVALVAGCGSFEDPNIVIDFRVLAMTAEPPEQVVPFDPVNPPEDIEELGLVDTTICALIADPAEARGMAWRMNVCARTDTRRCDDPERPFFEFARGRIDDPERADEPQPACGVLSPDPALALVLEDAISLDDLAGFGGVDVAVEIVVTAGDEELHGSKRVRYSPQLPPERVGNRNPTVEQIDVLEGGPSPLPLGRCADQPDPIEVASGGELRLEPVEPPGVREEYVVPTLDGGSRRFTELLRYQWLATAGEWTRGTTGGERDASGQLPPLDTRWRAPDDITEPTDVSLWMLQRDERLGQAWFESCVRVVP